MSTATSFPGIVPSSRSFSPGNWPVKIYKAQNGDETRILYGDKKSGMKLTLTYKNILDTQADDFIDHFESLNGTYKTFTISSTVQAKLIKGWAGDSEVGTAKKTILDPTRYDNKWRYSGPPQIRQTFSGRSTISFTLVSAL